MPVNCFETTDGSNTVTVNIVGHGAVENAYVTFSGSEAVGGIPSTEINIEHLVSNVTETTFTFTTTSNATSTVGAGGGTNIVAEFQINPGLDTVVVGTGWGAGTWSRDSWGSSAGLAASVDTLRLWSHDNFGEDLILNVYDDGIYYWDKSENYAAPFQRAVPLYSVLSADENTPTIARKVLVSDRDRHVIAFACDGVGTIGTQDPLLIRFSNQEDPFSWTPTATNTAGDLRLSSGSGIINALETRQQILVWTDVSLHAMQYLGAPFTFGVGLISENTTIMSPNAAVAVDDTVYWMGAEEFYVYTGAVQKLPCSIRQYIFNDFNSYQSEKVFAALNAAYAEVWWFYPSEASDSIDRYAVFNYEQNIWYFGTLERTAWVDRGILPYPVAAGADNYLYYQEYNCSDGSTEPFSPIEAYIESSQIDIQDGENFAFIRKIIPDITFDGSTAESPSANMVLKARNFPGGNYLQSDTAQVDRSATVPVEQFTNQVNLRLRGRSFALRVESDELGVSWRLGSPRIEIRPDGKR